MRTIWKGQLVFGRIAIPVGLAPTFADGDVAFRTLHRECSTPLAMRRWCPLHERPVEADETVRGWEVAPGQYVLVDDADLEAIAPDPGDRSIVIGCFVDTCELDPLWRHRGYYLTPAGHGLGRDAYALLNEALGETATVAIARFNAWGSELLAAIRPHGDGHRTLVLDTLRYPADILPPDPIDEQLAGADFTPDELLLATELIDRLHQRIGKTDLTSRHRDRLSALLEAKLAGEPIVRPAGLDPVETEPPGADLADALRASIRSAPRRRRARATTAAR